MNLLLAVIKFFIDKLTAVGDWILEYTWIKEHGSLKFRLLQYVPACIVQTTKYIKLKNFFEIKFLLGLLIEIIQLKEEMIVIE